MVGPQRFAAWQVAAAVLVLEGEMHIETLTRKVIESELSTVGMRGNRNTPRQSICPQLLKRSDVFGPGTWRGWYRVPQPDEVRKDPRVASVIRRLERP